jgi:hypothetical protein
LRTVCTWELGGDAAQTSDPFPGLYKKDKGFRRYAAGVERALALFDTNQQVWADYISFLSRLLKVWTPHQSQTGRHTDVGMFAGYSNPPSRNLRHPS